MKAATQACELSVGCLKLNGESVATYSTRGENVLGKENALGLNNEEVEELVDVSDEAVERFARHGVVSAGTDLGS